MNDAEDIITDTDRDLSKERWKIVEQLKKIMVKGRTSDSIMFKKLDKNVWKVQTKRVNEVIKYLKGKGNTEANNLIMAASVWVAEEIGLKKAEHRNKNEPIWKRRNEGDINRLRQKVNFLEKESKGELGLKKKRELSE